MEAFILMDIIQDKQISEYYGDQKELINTLTYLAGCNNYVFRGYNLQEQLLPNIIRKKDLSNVENNLLDEFEKFGSHYFVARTPIDFLSYGQHYGLPTRLLDFTYNPFIALAFALFSKKSPGNYKNTEDKDFYYIRYCRIGENIHLKGIPSYDAFTFGCFEWDSISKRTQEVLRYYTSCLSNADDIFFLDYVKGLQSCDHQQGICADEYLECMTQKVRNRKLGFIDPSQSNQRMIMQQGLFMLPYSLSVEEHYDLIYQNTSVLKIHKDLRESLQDYLNTLGYNTFRLMPDLPSVCQAVTQKVLDKRSDERNLFKSTRNNMKRYCSCPRCKYVGPSKYENECPLCGFISDDD